MSLRPCVSGSCFEICRVPPRVPLAIRSRGATGARVARDSDASETWGSAKLASPAYLMGVRGGLLSQRDASTGDTPWSGQPAAPAVAPRHVSPGPCSLLTVAEVAAELGVDVDTARPWLQQRGLLREVPGLPGVERVVASDLVSAVRGEGTSGL